MRRTCLTRTNSCALQQQPTLWAANGFTHVRHDIPLWMEPLMEVCNPYVMTDSPDVLSMGRRCIDQGYEFQWLAHVSKPFFVTPLGEGGLSRLRSTPAFLFCPSAPNLPRRLRNLLLPWSVTGRRRIQPRRPTLIVSARILAWSWSGVLRNAACPRPLQRRPMRVTALSKSPRRNSISLARRSITTNSDTIPQPRPDNVCEATSSTCEICKDCLLLHQPNRGRHSVEPFEQFG